MTRYSGVIIPATAGDTTHPMASLYATTGGRPVVREVGVFNTTAVAVAVELIRLTSAGTVGAAVTEGCEDDPGRINLATMAGTHTSTAPGFGAVLRIAHLGAAVGSGVIWTFGGNGLVIPATTGDGVGVMCATGTSQVCSVYLSWDE